MAEQAERGYLLREWYPHRGKDKLAVLLRREGWPVLVLMVGRILPPRSPKHSGQVEHANRPHTEKFYELPPFRFPSPSSTEDFRLGSKPTTPSALTRPPATSPPWSFSTNPHPKERSPSVTNQLDEFTK